MGRSGHFRGRSPCPPQTWRSRSCVCTSCVLRTHLPFTKVCVKRFVMRIPSCFCASIDLNRYLKEPYCATAREKCHAPKCEGPAKREYPAGARGTPRTRHGNTSRHPVGTVTRQLHYVELRSFPASNLVFNSLIGVTTTNGVSHHSCLSKNHVFTSTCAAI